MDFRETGANSTKAESEVLCGNEFRASGQIEMAISKYKRAIYLFIYSIEGTQKENQKAFYQFRINQVLVLLNNAEKELHQKLSSLTELKQYASIPSNKSLILSQSESSNIRCTVNYPQLFDSNPSLSQYSSHQDDIPTVEPIIETGDIIQPPLPSFQPSASSNNPKSSFLISDRIIDLRHFKIIKNLGFGSFGTVFLAEEISTGDQFAIKELNSIESSEDQRSFLREVEALTQAVYPAVLHLRGFCLNPTPSIVTEYLPGGSLQDVISGNKQMNKTQRVKALYGVASAMRYLHEKLSIVHRDLKPANVMLNQNMEPVVGDFGLAKMMTKMMMRQTQKAGSPVYMAPELMCSREYTNKVDVYSFGILCYELLSESLAFEEITNIPDLIRIVVRGNRPNLNNTKISISFRDLISKCWKDDADKRPSFRDIVRDLRSDQFLDGIDKNDFMEYSTRLRKADSF